MNNSFTYKEMATVMFDLNPISEGPLRVLVLNRKKKLKTYKAELKNKCV